MAATATKPAASVPAPAPVQDDGDPIEQYKMPRPCLGQEVLFYHYGKKDQPRVPEIAFVTRVGQRTIIIRTASGAAKDEVRHVTDPKLALNEELRLMGAWDYSENYYNTISLRGEVAQLKADVEALKAALK